MAESIIIQSRVRETVKGVKEDFRISEDYLAAVNTKVEQIVKESAARAEKNGRKTLQPQDL